MMLDKLRAWIDSRGRDKQEIVNRLTSGNVKSGNNKRIGDNSQSTGHVHNSMLPEGGLQQVLAQHNVHVVSATSVRRLILAARSTRTQLWSGSTLRQNAMGPRLRYWWSARLARHQ